MRKHIVILVLLILLVSAALIIFFLKVHYTPAVASTQASTIDSILSLLFVIASVIFAVCLVALIYSMIFFRRRSGDMEDGPSWQGHSIAEILWTLIPLAIVLFLSVYGALALKDISYANGPVKELEVRVTAQQFAWRFEYPEHNLSTAELGLPVNRPILFKLISRDVIHSLWVPEFRVKQDAVPGMETLLRVTPTRIGSYKIMCAELCGVAHSFMLAPVKVITEEEFNKWVAQQSSK